jgi:hypothetical protein
MEKLSKTTMALGATFEARGQQVTPNALKIMAQDLADYDLDVIEIALTRCRKEIKGWVSIADIIELIDQQDGRPSVEEAWNLALIGQSNTETVVWTNEVSEALGDCAEILAAGDKVGARMAFKSAYDRIVSQNRREGIHAKWYASLGSDISKRSLSLTRAVELGRLTQDRANNLLPNMRQPETDMSKLLEGSKVAAKDSELAKKALNDIRGLLDEGVST